MNPKDSPPQRSAWQTLKMAALALLVFAFFTWLLNLIPGRVLILAPGAARPTVPFVEVGPTPLPATSPAPAVQAAEPTSTQPTAPTLPASLAPAAGVSTLPATPPAARWQQLAGSSQFPAAAFTSLAGPGGSADLLLAASHGAGVFLSTDGGQTWEPASSGLGQGTVAQLAFHPQDDQQVFAALSDQGGVFQSNDGGRSWQAARSGIVLAMGWDKSAAVAIAAQDPHALYFSDATGGIYRSAGEPVSWSLQASQCPRPTALLVDPRDSSRLYAPSFGGGADCLGGIYASSDAGLTWERLTTPEMAASQGGDWWRLALDLNDALTLYASGPSGAYRSRDDGQTWELIGKRCDWIAINPADHAVFCRSEQRLWISPDSGSSWQENVELVQRQPMSSSPVHFVPGSEVVFVADQAMLKSTDLGETWQSLAGPQAAARMRLSIDPTDPQRLFLTLVDPPGKILRSQDGGLSWEVVLEGIEAGGRLAIDAAGTLYYPNPAGLGNGLHRSKDGGSTWDQFGYGHPVNNPWQILIDPLNPGRLWLAGECDPRLAVSQDAGLTFTEAAGISGPICQPILAGDPSGQRLYMFAWGSSYTSADGGAAWSRITDPGGLFRAAAVDPANPEAAYLGSTHQGVLKTSDGGQTWQARNQGLTNLAVSDLLADPHTPGLLYAATGGGLFVSRNHGDLWQPLQAGLGANPIVYSLALSPDDPRRIYAVTPDGVFVLEGAS